MRSYDFIRSSSDCAIIWKEERISYRELLAHVAQYRELFSGMKPGKIAIFSPNRPEWAYAFFAGWADGAVVVPIDCMASADEVAFILNDCTPEVIFCSRDTESLLRLACERLTYRFTIMVFDDISVQATQAIPDTLTIEDTERTAVIIYTSGTTGSPKGVMLSFGNLIANIDAVSIEIPIFTPERKVLALLPMHHIFPLIGTLVAPVAVGATIAFSPGMTSDAIMATLSHGIAIMIGVPRLYAVIRKGIMDKINQKTVTRLLFKLIRLINVRAVSKLVFRKVHDKLGGKMEYMVCGGAKLDEDVARDYKALGFEMLEGFGMTEAAPMITFTRPGRWRIGSAGEALPGLEIRIAENDEICARGPNIMQGYYNRPEETAEILREGWLHTGDVGFVRNGFIHITGRIKEIIVLPNGKNINPAEIETKLTEMSACIAETAVLFYKEALHALIYPDFRLVSEKGILNFDEFVRWDVVDRYNRAASPAKRILQYTIVKEEIPKTRLGKIQRFKLAELVESRQNRERHAPPEPGFEEYQVIRDYMKEQTRSEIRPDDHIEIDLGMDSLDKVSLLTFLNSTFGTDIREDALLQNATVEKLAQYLREKKQKMAVEVVRWGAIFKEHVDLTLPRRWFTMNLFRNTASVLLKFYFRMRGEGAENIPEGPCIIAPNHQSFIDGLFVAIYMKYNVLKETYFYAKAKHVRNRWIRALANRNNVIVMDINRDLKQSLQKLGEVLKNGKNIIIFPEGTRTRDGRLNTFKRTFAILSRELNVPIVPVSIKGAFEAFPKGNRIPRIWSKISVTFLPAVYPEDRDYDAIADTVYQRVLDNQSAP